jgi:hypothetical protein
MTRDRRTSDRLGALLGFLGNAALAIAALALFVIVCLVVAAVVMSLRP